MNSRSLIKRWFGIVPLLLMGGLLWALLTYLVHSGGEGDSFAARAEQALISKTLAASHWGVPRGSPVKVVEISERDRRYSTKSDDPYFKALSQVISKSPTAIFLSWSLFFADKNIEKRLLNIVNDSPVTTKIVMFVNRSYFDKVSHEIIDNLDVRVLGECDGELLGGCHFGSKMNSAVYEIATIVGGGVVNIPKFHLSSNLPYPGISLLFYLPDWDSVPRLDISDLDSGAGDIKRGDFVFISDFISALEKEKLTKVAIPDDRYQFGSILLDTYQVLPLVAGMLFHNKTISIPPIWVTTILMVCLCFVVAVLMWKLGRVAAFTVFVVYTFAYPVGNKLSVEVFKVYIPMFDFVYFGFVTFFVTSYLKASTDSFRRWRLNARTRVLSRSFELKTNFISLISHDLNTPVAKMAGLVEVLLMKENSSGISKDLEFVQKEVVRLQIAVRAVLISARIDGEALNKRSMSLAGLKEEFDDRVSPILGKLGYNFKFAVGNSSSDEIMRPFVVDGRVICYGLIALIALYNSNGLNFFEVQAFVQDIEQVGDDSPSVAVFFRIKSQYTKLSKSLRSALFLRSGQSFVEISEDFYEESLVHLIHLILDHTDGAITVVEREVGEVVGMKMFV